MRLQLSRPVFRKSLVCTLALLAFASTATVSHAQFLDIATLTTGTSGTFAGFLNGIPVAGAITGNDGSFQFFPTGTLFSESTIDNTSPQYSYSNIYTPSVALTDRIGYQKVPTNGTATVTIAFGAPITNPVFQVANLDGALFDFAPTSGLIGLALLSGNGDGTSGLGVVGTTVQDLNPAIIGVDPTTPPPTTGPRSGYGSVQLLGTFTTIAFNAVTSIGGDSGSFTLSSAPAAVPEPGSIALLIGMGVTGAGFLARRRR